MNSYVPGQCNIGEDEIQQRQQSGLFFLLIAIIYGIYIIVFKVPFFLRLVEFPVVFGAAIGIIQAKQRFCALFAILKEQNFGPLGTTQKILNDQYAKEDLKKALKIIVQSLLIATLVTAILLFLAAIGI